MEGYRREYMDRSEGNYQLGRSAKIHIGSIVLDGEGRSEQWLSWSSSFIEEEQRSMKRNSRMIGKQGHVGQYQWRRTRSAEGCQGQWSFSVGNGEGLGLSMDKTDIEWKHNIMCGVKGETIWKGNINCQIREETDRKNNNDEGAVKIIIMEK